MSQVVGDSVLEVVPVGEILVRVLEDKLSDGVESADEG